MDHVLPHEWQALCLIVFTLGLRHGLDADHLATIDGLTRWNARAGRAIARWCGALFSLGHGAVVVAIAVVVGSAAGRWQVPGWLDAFGAWVSIAFLAVLGLLNLHAVFRASAGEMVAPVGIKGRLLGRFSRAASAGGVALVGALFALSFDTLSQAALFAVAATRFGGWHNALVLGLLFLSGMLLVDGANGLWISRLLSRADRTALVASRVMGLSVAALSLAVAGFGTLCRWLPELAGWSEGRETLLGAGVLAMLAGSYLLALRLAQPFAAAAPGRR